MSSFSESYDESNSDDEFKLRKSIKKKQMRLRGTTRHKYIPTPKKNFSTHLAQTLFLTTLKYTL